MRSSKFDLKFVCKYIRLNVFVKSKAQPAIFTIQCRWIKYGLALSVCWMKWHIHEPIFAKRLSQFKLDRVVYWTLEPNSFSIGFPLVGRHLFRRHSHPFAILCFNVVFTDGTYFSLIIQCDPADAISLFNGKCRFICKFCINTTEFIWRRRRWQFEIEGYW